MNRRSFLGSAAALPILALPQVAAADGSRVFAEHGVAIRGADPVAYFRGHGAVAGSVKERVRWLGAVWLFASTENREAFEADPRRFAPRFGGYCAYTLAMGDLAPSDPRAYALHAGRLYLVESLAVRELWLADLARNIRQAEKNWLASLG